MENNNNSVKRKQYVRGFLAMFVAVGFMGIIILLAIRNLPEMSKEIVMLFGTIVGGLLATFKDVYGYYFGSSQGSDDKTEILGRQ